MTTPLRDDTLYMSWELRLMLTHIAKAKALSSADELGEVWLRERIAQDYPDLAAQIEAVQKKHKDDWKELDEELRAKEPKCF